MYFGNINIFYIISGVIVIKLINLNMYRRKFFYQYYLFHIKKWLATDPGFFIRGLDWIRIRGKITLGLVSFQP